MKGLTFLLEGVIIKLQPFDSLYKREDPISWGHDSVCIPQDHTFDAVLGIQRMPR